MSPTSAPAWAASPAQRYIAEFLGALVVVGTTLLSGGHPLAVGAAVAAAVALCRGVSGGFVNPAVTVAVLATGGGAPSLGPTDAFAYVVAQLAGALVAAAAAGALW